MWDKDVVYAAQLRMRLGCAGSVGTIVALLALPGCASGAPPPPQPTPTEITTHVGSKFTVRLDANATTGYRWHLTVAPNPAIAQLLDSNYEVNGPATGSGGTEVWRFNALAIGTTRLEFAYARPWEHGHPAARTHTVAVHVQPY